MKCRNCVSCSAVNLLNCHRWHTAALTTTKKVINLCMFYLFKCRCQLSSCQPSQLPQMSHRAAVGRIEKRFIDCHKLIRNVTILISYLTEKVHVVFISSPVLSLLYQKNDSEGYTIVVLYKFNELYFASIYTLTLLATEPYCYTLVM